MRAVFELLCTFDHFCFELKSMSALDIVLCLLDITSCFSGGPPMLRLLPLSPLKLLIKMVMMNAYPFRTICISYVLLSLRIYE